MVSPKEGPSLLRLPNYHIASYTQLFIHILLLLKHRPTFDINVRIFYRTPHATFRIVTFFHYTVIIIRLCSSGPMLTDIPACTPILFLFTSICLS